MALAISAQFAMTPVAAHRSTTQGPYRFVVGWLEEPSIVGNQNGLDFEIELLSDRSPVLDAHQNLTATLTKGSSTISPPLVPQFGRPGRYTFVVIPTEPGNYSLHVTGTLNGTAIDFTLDLDEVVPASDLQFPRPSPTIEDLQGQVGGLQGQIVALLAVATIGLILAGITTTMLLLPIFRLRIRR